LEDQGVGEKMGSDGSSGDWLGGCGLDSTGSGQGPVAGCGKCGDEPSGSCATELVSYTQEGFAADNIWRESSKEDQEEMGGCSEGGLF
jgi:hypothetical protein